MYMEHQERIDLILLDMIMPGISGEKTFKALGEINCNVKVILASGYSMGDKTQYLLKSGCQGFLQKPFGISELSRKVREVLDVHKE